jgi:hypothetical protein
VRLPEPHAALLWAAIVTAGVILVPALAGAGRSDFVGAEVCGECHREAFEAWSKSAHARASESLGRRVASRRCLSCHSTGEAPAGRPFYSGVQCEACHGPGAGYAPEDIMRNPTLSRDLGLRELGSEEQRRALCLGCHRSSTRLRAFDVTAAWKRIQHQ